jgi:uncharacterized OB-fold protein
MSTPPVERIPVAEGLFTWPSDSPRLLGSQCDSCGETTFPVQQGCPSCNSHASKEIPLSPRGTLWTWTIQNFPPPHPYIGDVENFVPYGVGYIELPEGVRVEARLTESDPAALSIGMEMELTLEPFGNDDEGREVVTFAFRPVAGD